MKRRRRRASRVARALCVASFAAISPGAAWAGAGGPRYPISDEIQVYTDDINARGQFGLELHVNTTPSGETEPAYPGAVPPAHGWRITPEFSYGLGNDLEAGLYLPTTTNAQEGSFYYFGGVKLRLKWLPIHPGEGEAGWFAGANVEISDLNKSFSDSRYSTELRLIGGYRGERWLIAVNPIFEWALSKGYRGGGPDTTFAFKAAYEVVPGIAIGPEYYNTYGQLGNPEPRGQQDRILFVALDVDRAPLDFNFGIGRGLTSASDRWTLKAIIQVPFR
jgi:hypothetical protein